MRADASDELVVNGAREFSELFGGDTLITLRTKQNHLITNVCSNDIAHIYHAHIHANATNNFASLATN